MKENEKKTSASIKAINFTLLGGGVVIAMSQAVLPWLQALCLHLKHNSKLLKIYWFDDYVKKKKLEYAVIAKFMWC